MTNRSTIVCLALLCLTAGRAAAFQPVEQAHLAGEPPALTEEEPWSFSAALTLLETPDQNVYVIPVVTADKGVLHLEGRYNYEAKDTASLWVGYNLSAAAKEEGGLSVDFTPMLGAVMGEVSGVAPGYELTLAWKGLELYTEGEFVFSTETDDDNFFYSWSQLTYAPVDSFRFGVAFQRTQAYESGREVDVGPYIGFTFQHVDVSGWALNLDDDHPIYGLSVGIEF